MVDYGDQIKALRREQSRLNELILNMLSYADLTTTDQCAVLEGLRNKLAGVETELERLEPGYSQCAD